MSPHAEHGTVVSHQHKHNLGHRISHKKYVLHTYVQHRNYESGYSCNSLAEAHNTWQPIRMLHTGPAHYRYRDSNCHLACNYVSICFPLTLFLPRDSALSHTFKEHFLFAPKSVFSHTPILVAASTMCIILCRYEKLKSRCGLVG